MIDFIYSLWPVWFVIIEILILLGLYKFYISHLNAEVWEAKAKEEGWLTALLQPAILETATLVSTSVFEEIEHKYRQQMGVLSRVSKSGAKDDDEMGLSMSEEILKGMGFKSPHALMVFRLAKGLMGVASEGAGRVETTSTPQHEEDMKFEDYF